MLAVPLHHSENWNRTLYLIQSRKRDEATYGAIVIHPECQHKCGYLNIDSKDWHRSPMSDEPFPNDVTFQGLGSTLLSVPISLRKNIPIQEKNFWIGIDYFGHRLQPTDEEVVEKLTSLYDSFLDSIYEESNA